MKILCGVKYGDNTIMLVTMAETGGELSSIHVKPSDPKWPAVNLACFEKDVATLERLLFPQKDVVKAVSPDTYTTTGKKPLFDTDPPLHPSTAIRQRIVSLIHEVTGMDNVLQLGDYDSLLQAGIDSLDGAALAVEAERVFGIEFPSDFLERCHTIGIAVREVQKLLAKSDKPEPTYQEEYDKGFKLGKRHGTRRCKRLYYEGDERVTAYPARRQFIEGYNKGYRASRWDYAQK